MAEMQFQVKITAIGEVRDKYGNLLSAEPVELLNETIAESELRDSEGTDE